MIPRLLTAVAATLLFAASSGCTADTSSPIDPGPPANAEIAKSALERDANPDVPAEDLAELVAGHTAFSFDLYHQLAADPGNVVFSPHSVSVALAMTWAGAAGDTATQLADALHFTLPPADQHAAFNALDLALASRGEGASGKDGEPFRLRVVNAAWAERDYTFLPTFLDTLALNYGAGIYLLDFLQAAEEARLTINAWVAEQTEDRIPDLLPEGSVNRDTRLVLTNAVYFNASWEIQFDPDLTVDAPFHRLDGGPVDVPTMALTESFRYAAADDWAAVELPYDGGEVAMLLATTTGDAAFAAFEAGLSSTWLAAVDAALTPTEVEVHLPRFEYRQGAALVEPLMALGVTDAFDPSLADLSGMDGTRALSVGGVIHEAFIALDETGTEAAAATAVIVGTTSVPPPPTPVVFDRPFVYLIRDVATGAILFVGRVVDPSAE